MLAAARWLQGTLLGTIATTVAVIAVATMGSMMLAGRIDWKRGVSLVVGCFILFGAPSIAAGIQSYVKGDAAYTPPIYSPASSVPSPPPLPATPYDPYAGASVPPG